MKIYLSIHLPNFLSVYLSICLSIILSVDQCVCDSFFYPTYFVLSICLHNCFSCIPNIFLNSCYQLLSLFLYLVLFYCEFYSDNVLSIHVFWETFLDDSTFFFILIFFWCVNISCTLCQGSKFQLQKSRISIGFI